MDKPDIRYPRILAGQRPRTLQELYTNALRWCQGSNGRDAYNNDVSEFAPEAARWCLGGALNVVYGPLGNETRAEAVRKLLDVLNKDHKSAVDDNIHDGVVTWNDAEGRTFKDVRKLVVEAGV